MSYWKGDEIKETSQKGNYLNAKGLKKGETRLRIMEQPISGWEDWKDKKPYRYRKEPKESFDELQPARQFVCFYVWDYEREDLFIFSITQKQIMVPLKKLASDQDWGDLTGFDIKVIKSTFTNKNGEEQIKYEVQPVPHKPISLQMRKSLNDKPVNLDVLFDNGNPWCEEAIAMKDMSDDEVELFEMDSNNLPEANILLDQLSESMELDGIDTKFLDQYVEVVAKLQNKSTKDVISSALLPDLSGIFKAKYINYLANKKAA